MIWRDSEIRSSADYYTLRGEVLRSGSSDDHDSIGLNSDPATLLNLVSFYFFLPGDSKKIGE